VTSVNEQTAIETEPPQAQQDDDASIVPEVEVGLDDHETRDDETGGGSDDGSDGDGSDRIPVEEWLEQAASMTREILRPDIVDESSPADRAHRRRTLVTARRSTASEPDAGPSGTVGPDDPGDSRSTGSNQQKGSSTSQPGKEIVGAFRPVLSAGSDGRWTPAGSDQDDDNRVIIGIVQTLPTNDVTRPLPLDRSSQQSPLTAERLGALALVVAVLMTIGGGAGYFIADRMDERWTAEAEVVLDVGQEQADRYLATQQVLIQSSAVLERAVVELPVDRDYIEKNLKVFPVESSTALGITFVDTDASLARSVVSTVLDAYLVEVESEATSTTRDVYRRRLDELAEQRQLIEGRLIPLQAANAEAEAAELPPPHPSEVRRLSLESEQLLSQMAQLEEAMLAAEVEERSRIGALVVTEPRLLSEPAWPKPLALAAVGMLVGLVIAVLFLFLASIRYQSPTSDPEESAS